MSKRSQPDSQRLDSIPPPKKARYNYDIQLMQSRTLPRMTTNSDEETASETEQSQVTVSYTNEATLVSTSAPIALQSKSKRRIPNETTNKSPDDWCPLQWLRNRVYHQDAEEFFAILPQPEADSVAKELLMHVGASTTFIKNTIHNLDIMNIITKHIQNQHENNKNKDQNHYHSSKKSRRFSNKQKKRWIREQNEVINTFNPRELTQNTQQYINKIQSDMERYHTNDTQYNIYENQRKAIWKSIPNGNPQYTITPTPPPNNTTNYDDFVSQKHKKHTIMNYEHEQESDFMSSSDHDSDSDEDFSLCNDTIKKKKRRKKKRKKKQHDEALYSEGLQSKNPVYTDTQPQRFWSKFRGYFEPSDPDTLRALIPSLQCDSYPVKIPSLPNEKSFMNKISFDDISFDDISFDDNDLYFAEMPKNYEYFRGDKRYIDEQHNIESMDRTKHLKQSAMHQHYPSKSLMGHSFDQRTLSCMVHECNGMYDIEHQVDENYWTKIGKKKVKNHKEEYKMIEPMIKYKSPVDIKREKAMTFEESLRQQIGQIFFNNNAKEVGKIVSMPWHRRLDDECCATIKSLEGTMETFCFDHAPNDVEVNIKIAMEIEQIVLNEDPRYYQAYKELMNHVAEIEKNYMHSNGEFVIDEETLSEPSWAQYFKEKHNLPIDDAVKAYLTSRYVRTAEEFKNEK